jgi:hypothetical protein
VALDLNNLWAIEEEEYRKQDILIPSIKIIL